MVSTNEKVKEITHIYDKIMKRILTLSGTAVINLINGLLTPVTLLTLLFSTTGPNTPMMT